MKRITHFFCFCFLTVLVFASCTGGKTKSFSSSSLSSSSTFSDSICYYLGLSNGVGLRGFFEKNEIEFKEDLFISGLEDGFSYRDTIMKIDNYKIRELLERNISNHKKAKGQKFLHENKKNDSVKVLESGLQYKVLVEGTGISPEISDTISVKYKLTSVTGEVYEASRDEEPMKVPLNNMIQGWKEALPLMKTGAKYVLYIPTELAYSYGQLAGETLVFEVELVDVTKGPKDEKTAQ